MSKLSTILRITGQVAGGLAGVQVPSGKDANQTDLNSDGRMSPLELAFDIVKPVAAELASAGADLNTVTEKVHQWVNATAVRVGKGE